MQRKLFRMTKYKCFYLLLVFATGTSVSSTNEIIMRCQMQGNQLVEAFNSTWRYRENWNGSPSINSRRQGNWGSSWCRDHQQECEIGDRGGYRIYRAGEEIVEETIDFILFDWTITIWDDAVSEGTVVGSISPKCFPVKS